MENQNGKPINRLKILLEHDMRFCWLFVVE